MTFKFYHIERQYTTVSQIYPEIGNGIAKYDYAACLSRCNGTFCYKFSFRSASIGLSFLTCRIAYSIVANTTINTLATASATLYQGMKKLRSTDRIVTRNMRYVTKNAAGRPYNKPFKPYRIHSKFIILRKPRCVVPMDFNIANSRLRRWIFVEMVLNTFAVAMREIRMMNP